jgi:hypothetical protein
VRVAVDDSDRLSSLQGCAADIFALGEVTALLATGSPAMVQALVDDPTTPVVALPCAGGLLELARAMLALRLVLIEAPGTLVFDEVDAGIGGAVAAAVGERLARLAREAQVLVVTHSPQVAARARPRAHGADECNVQDSGRCKGQAISFPTELGASL